MPNGVADGNVAQSPVDDLGNAFMGCGCLLILVVLAFIHGLRWVVRLVNAWLEFMVLGFLTVKPYRGEE